MTDTIVWISGGTQGLGAGLVRMCPYPGARIINLSRRPHPDVESITLDMTDPATWDDVERHFRAELASFTGRRAIFIHNAYVSGATGYVGEVDQAAYRRDVIGNAACSMILGESFLRAVGPGYESGLVMLSSAAAGVPWEGNAVYGAAKAGIEHWVRVVRRERQTRGTGPWVVAVRPGFVDSPSLRESAALDPHIYPIAPVIAEGIRTGKNLLDPDTAARDIWAALPPPPGKSVLWFGAPPEGA